MNTKIDLQVSQTLPNSIGYAQPEKKKSSAELEGQLLGVAGLEAKVMYELSEILQKNSDLAADQTNLSLQGYVAEMKSGAEAQRSATRDEAQKLEQGAIQSFVSSGIGLAQSGVGMYQTMKLSGTGDELASLSKLNKALKSQQVAQANPAYVAPQAPAGQSLSAELQQLQRGDFSNPETLIPEVQNLTPSEVNRLTKQIDTEMQAASARQQTAAQEVMGKREAYSALIGIGDKINSGVIGTMQQNKEKQKAESQFDGTVLSASSGVMEKATQSNSSNASQEQQQRLTMLNQVAQAIRDSSHV